jgi:hypothetical protein
MQASARYKSEDAQTVKKLECVCDQLQIPHNNSVKIFQCYVMQEVTVKPTILNRLYCGLFNEVVSS